MATPASTRGWRHAFTARRECQGAGRLLPLSVDVLIVAASMVLLHEARNGRTAPVLARCMLCGIGATVGAAALWEHARTSPQASS